MIRDYSHRFHGKSGKNRTPKKDTKAGVSTMQKTIGALMLLIMCCGLLFTFWMGQEIQNTLNELSNGKKIQEEFSSMQESLMLERDHLLTREKIEIAALKQGLYRPTANQIMRP